MASSGRGPAAVLALYELLYVYEGQVRVCRAHQPGVAQVAASSTDVADLRCLATSCRVSGQCQRDAQSSPPSSIAVSLSSLRSIV